MKFHLKAALLGKNPDEDRGNEGKRKAKHLTMMDLYKLIFFSKMSHLLLEDDKLILSDKLIFFSKMTHLLLETIVSGIIALTHEVYNTDEYLTKEATKISDLEKSIKDLEESLK